MPVNSSRFNRFLWLMLACLTASVGARAELPELTEQQLAALGKQIFANECASQNSCLTSWNEGEDFPSLGIGHFIWYQANQQEVFEETFPTLLQYFQTRGVALPDWLLATRHADSPWRSRAEFITAQQSQQMIELRHLLETTQGLQAHFIAQRLYDTLPAIIDAAEAEQRETLASHAQEIAIATPPYGLYALIDYVHFKGSGLSPSERYQDQGWGLLQVLEAMPATESRLEVFVVAAEQVLSRRVANAPVERNEQRWLRGWINRLQTYLPQSGALDSL